MLVLKGQVTNPAPGPFWGLLFRKANGVRGEAAEYRYGNNAARKPCLLFCSTLADSALKEEKATTQRVKRRVCISHNG